jgi:hypothetical protein
MVSLLALALYLSSTLATTAADSLDHLLTVVVQRTEEHPTLQTVEAVALLSALVLLVGGGVLRVLR